MGTEQTPGERNNAAVKEAEKRPHERTAFYNVSEGDEAMVFALDQGFMSGTVKKIEPIEELYGNPVYRVRFTNGHACRVVHHAVCYIFTPPENVLYPNGRCSACGHGISDEGYCTNAYCTRAEFEYAFKSDGPDVTMSVTGGNVYLNLGGPPGAIGIAEIDIDHFLEVVDKLREDTQHD